MRFKTIGATLAMLLILHCTLVAADDNASPPATQPATQPIKAQEFGGLVKAVKPESHTITVVLWNEDKKSYDVGSPVSLVLAKDTVIDGDRQAATVGDIESGKKYAAVSQQSLADIFSGTGAADTPADTIKALGDLVGKKIDVHCDANGAPEKIGFVIMFGGESAPAMVGPNGGGSGSGKLKDVGDTAGA